MTHSKKCPRCGRETPANSPEGVCPRCLVEINFDTEAISGSTSATSSDRGRPSSRPTPMTAEEVARHFPELEILGLLGAGGMGAVYKARQPNLDRLVALKILDQRRRDPGFVERFSREAKTLARLNHPNIVGVHQFGEREGLFFLIMELVDGATLRDLLRDGKMQPEQALAIVPPICDALQFAHEKGVVHRDIKPENILIDKEGHVKVADFGIARIAGLERAENLTGEGQVIGTAHYMAPEQLERPAEVDHRADIYGLGVVFYEMLTGELPLGQFLHPSKKVAIDVRLDEIVLKALAKEPERRYQQASEVRTGLATATGRTPKVSEPLPPLKLGGGWVDWTAATVLLLPLIAGAFLNPDPIYLGAAIALIALAASFLAPWFRARRIRRGQQDREIETIALSFPSLRPGAKRAAYSAKIRAMQEQGRTFLMSEPHLWTSILFRGKTLLLHFLLPPGEPLSTGSSRLPPRRPWQLFAIAAVFILTGTSALWDLATDWSWIFDPYTQIYNYNFNFTILALPIGIGLLRLRRWWRIAALTVSALFFAGVLIMAATLAIQGKLLRLVSGTDRFVASQLEFLGVLGISCLALALIAWMFAVLRRPNVKMLFHKRGFNRPWLEWAVLAGVLLPALAIAGLLRPDDAGVINGDTRLSASDFGPVIERVLSPDDIERTFLNLATGDFVPDDANAMTNLPWWERMARIPEADMMTLIHEGETCLATPRSTTLFRGVPAEAFDEPRRLTRGHVSFLRERNRPQASPGPGEIREPEPGTYLFQTRQGAAGILQVLEITENPGAVRIRFKLLDLETA